MNKLSRSGLCAFGLAVVALAGCHKVSEPAPATAAKESSVLAPASRARTAAEQIAESRCEREQQCGNIGNDNKYATSQECFTRIQSDWREDLNGRDCPGGINQKELDQCLGQIRAEACENPFDTLARITECTAAQICIEQRAAQ
ncbi:MAG: hypothetical protein EOO73_22400 [Myxococcales bacterium]|nr:MAG: hypothetical protein EOO73_22400 [Myxococcales bacterium]